MSKNKKKKIILICAVFMIYIGITIFFRTHFYNTTIDGINMFGKSVDEAKDIISCKLDNYSLKINEEGQKTQYITGKDVGLKYDLGNKIENIKSKESPFWCIAGMLKHNSYEADKIVTIDDQLLEKTIDKLIESRNENIIENENAKIEYMNGQYMITEAVYGNVIDKDKLLDKITNSIEKVQFELDINNSDCYTKPQYTSKSKEVINARIFANKYLSTVITYQFGNEQEVLNKEQIHKWLKIDDEYKVHIDEKMVREYVNELAIRYNTVSKEREFKTSKGSIIKISGGSYGNEVDEKAEFELLIEAIKIGNKIKKEPKYSQKALFNGKNDIGNTYVEINLSMQHLWFYKDGSLITEGDIVSGDVSDNHTTPSGIYSLVYKQKDTVLRGPGYASPVSFWMPFNGGIGIHDASWRYTFGGNIYVNNGSHGCINAPYDLASTIYYNANQGMPIVCYY